jgi:hypothetical protein
MDKGGRRLTSDRRQFSYSYHMPERRSGEDRREGDERRDNDSQSSVIERRSMLRAC